MKGNGRRQISFGGGPASVPILLSSPVPGKLNIVSRHSVIPAKLVDALLVRTSFFGVNAIQWRRGSIKNKKSLFICLVKGFIAIK